MRYPNTIDKNIYIAYIRQENVKKKSGQSMEAMDLNWDLHYPESLVELCIKTIAENWNAFPVFSEIIICENRCLLADILNTGLPLSELCNHIKDDDAFWKRMFKEKWPNLINNSTNDKRWIEIYIEKYLAESLESLKPIEYNAEKMRQLIELCSPFVVNLCIDHLEASPESHQAVNDHIPFDVVLSHLTELKKLSITYDCKTIDTHFYLGCTSISDNDIKKLTRGLASSDLQEFNFHSSKLEAPMLKLIGRALDRSSMLCTISFANCRFGDSGLFAFIKVLTHDSLPNVKSIILTNNFISTDGAILLTNILRRRQIENLDLKLNPIMAEGATHILSLANIVSLNLSSCSFNESIEEALIFVLKSSKTLRKLNLSINKLGEDLGIKITNVLTNNKIIRKLDIRNTEISLKTKTNIDAIVLENRKKNNKVHQ